MPERPPASRVVDTLDVSGVGSVDPEQLLYAIRRSRALVGQRVAAPEGRRAFLDAATAACAKEGAQEVADEIGRLSRGCLLLEEAYAAVLSTLDKTQALAASPHKLPWAVIAVLTKETPQTIADDLKRALTSGPIIDPSAKQARSEDGTNYQADAAWDLAIETASGALKLLGHRLELFDSTGALLLRPKRSPSTELCNSAKVIMELGAKWHGIERTEDCWRWCGGEFVAEPTNRPDGREIRLIAHRYSPTRSHEFNVLANERLQRLLENARRAVDGLPLRRGAKSLAPNEWLSQVEISAAAALTVQLKLDPWDDSSEYDGLTLLEWLRGYALIRDIAETSKTGDAIVSLTRFELLSKLTSSGLRPQAAAQFINKTIFGRSSEDLADAPILASSDDRLHLLAPVIQFAELSLVILSRVRSAKSSIEGKGRALERFVMDRLTEAGLNATHGKFRIDRNEYEYDVLLRWEDVLFVFECKNYSIPQGSMRRLFEFKGEMKNALTQLDRLVDAIPELRDQIEGLVGGPWNQVVSAVVNGLPWSMGQVGRHSIYDASALARFLKPQPLLTPEPDSPEAKAIWHSQLRRPWKGASPTAQEFAHELAAPIQIRMLGREHEFFPVRFLLSEGVGFERVAVNRREPSIERSLRSLGLSDGDALTVANAYAAQTS